MHTPGFERVSAQSKKPSDDAPPVQQPMRAGSGKIRRNPSTDQLKVRRQMARSAANSMGATPLEATFNVIYHNIRRAAEGAPGYRQSLTALLAEMDAARGNVDVMHRAVAFWTPIMERAMRRPGTADRPASMMEAETYVSAMIDDLSWGGLRRVATLNSTTEGDVLETDPEQTDVVVAARAAMFPGATASADIVRRHASVRPITKAAWSIDDVRQVVERHQHAEIDGMILDAFSASALVQVYDALNPDNQAKLSGMSLDKAVSVVFKLMSKTSAQRTAGIFDIMDGQVEVARGATGVADLIDRVGELWLGDGGDLWGILLSAGWQTVEHEADYHWSMRAPDGSILGYIEGDLRDYTQYGGRLAARKTAGLSDSAPDYFRKNFNDLSDALAPYAIDLGDGTMGIQPGAPESLTRPWKGLLEHGYANGWIASRRTGSKRTAMPDEQGMTPDEIDMMWNRTYWSDRANSARVREESEQRLRDMKGQEIEVIKGRKIPIGTRGKVFWSGEGQWGWRIGFTDSSGQQFWTDAKNVELVGARTGSRTAAEDMNGNEVDGLDTDETWVGNEANFQIDAELRQIISMRGDRA